jgi:plasmid segregation protein ParM
MTSGVISVDDGGFSTCVVTKFHHENFKSIKGIHGNRKLTESNGKYDYVVEYCGDKFVMADLAYYDCKLPLQMHTKSKQHLFFDLSIFVAIHQFGYDDNYLITSVPIGMHTDSEKKGRIDRLKGEKTITVNGIKKTFNIRDVKIAPETAVAYWVNEEKGKSRYLDLGSRTVGFGTCINENGKPRFIDGESGTFYGRGLEALGESYDHAGLADYICGRLIKDWSENDNVYLLGGGAMDNKLVQCIQSYFPKAVPMGNPVMSNSLGMYLLGINFYEMD